MKTVLKLMLILISFVCFHNILNGKVEAQQQSSPVIINELMPNPTGSDNDYEWIELYNTSSGSVNLSGWILDDKTINNLTIPGNTYYIIAKNKTSLITRYPAIVNIYELNFSLNNSSDSVTLSNAEYSDTLEYSTSIENTSWERINACSVDVELNPENDSIEKQNVNYEENYCESVPLEINISLQVSRNQEQLCENFSGFLDDELQFSLVTEEKNRINNIDWYFNDVYTGTDSTLDLELNQLGVNKLKVEIFYDGNLKKIIDQDIQVFSRIKLNEIMANPVGEDKNNEWIEFFTESGSIIMTNWILKTSNDDEIINVDTQNYSIYYPNITLNNISGSIYIYTPTNLLSDMVVYEVQDEGQSISRTIDGYGSWTNLFEITPGRKNIEKSSTNVNTDIINIKYLKNLKLFQVGQDVNISGIVTTLRSQLGKDSFYIQDETGGVKIVLDSSITATFDIGDSLNIIGELKESRGELYVDVTSTSDLLSISKNNNVIPFTIDTELDNYEGCLVTLTGNISKTSGKTFYVTRYEQEFKISILDSTSITNPSKKIGDMITVVGIFSQWGEDEEGNANYRILPRFNSDINITQQSKIKSSVDQQKTNGQSNTNYVNYKSPELYISHNTVEQPFTTKKDNNILEIVVFSLSTIAGLGNLTISNKLLFK